MSKIELGVQAIGMPFKTMIFLRKAGGFSIARNIMNKFLKENTKTEILEEYQNNNNENKNLLFFDTTSTIRHKP